MRDLSLPHVYIVSFNIDYMHTSVSTAIESSIDPLDITRADIVKILERIYEVHKSKFTNLNYESKKDG